MTPPCPHCAIAAAELAAARERVAVLEGRVHNLECERAGHVAELRRSHAEARRLVLSTARAAR